jgi:hypothetical protein
MTGRDPDVYSDPPFRDPLYAARARHCTVSGRRILCNGETILAAPP